MYPVLVSTSNLPVWDDPVDREFFDSVHHDWSGFSQCSCGKLLVVVSVELFNLRSLGNRERVMLCGDINCHC